MSRVSRGFCALIYFKCPLRTVTNVLDRIIDSRDLILSDLSFPIARHALSCRALDLSVNVCALLRCEIPQYVRFERS